VSETPQDTLAKLARAACEEHPDVEGAKAAMLRAVNASSRLRDGLLAELIEAAIAGAIYDMRHHMREGLKSGACRTTAATMAGAKGIFAKALLDSWTFPDGSLLGDATRGTLTEWREWSAEKAEGFQKDARFYGVLAEKLGPKQKVRRKWTEEEVAALWASIAGAEAGPAVGSQPNLRRPASRRKPEEGEAAVPAPA